MAGLPETVKGQQNPLEGQTLNLRPPIWSLGRAYEDALRMHAVPIVDFLIQLQDGGVVRTDPTIATFSSGRGGEDLLFAKDWDRNLAGAINDLAYAAGLNVSFPDRIFSPGRFQYSNKFNENLELLDLPPALKARIEPRRAQIQAELVLDIQIRNLTMQSWKDPGNADIRRQIEELEKSREQRPATGPDYTLKISMEFDQKSYGPDYQKDTWSYQSLNHTISLVDSATIQAE